MSELTEEQIERHNQLYGKACELIHGRLLLDGQMEQARPGWLDRHRLRKAAGLFREALDLNPSGWQSMLFIGKVHQRLGENENALEWMVHANQIVPDNVSVAKELGLTAGRLGKHDLAIQIMEVVANSDKSDASLYTNLGVTYLLSGRAPDARIAFKRALDLEPDNGTTPKLLQLASDVAAGRTVCPTTETEIASAI